jgi:hypothetical protein
MPRGIMTYIDDDLHFKFKKACVSEGMSIKEKLEELIRSYLESMEPTEKPMEIVEEAKEESKDLIQRALEEAEKIGAK